MSGPAGLRHDGKGGRLKWTDKALENICGERADITPFADFLGEAVIEGDGELNNGIFVWRRLRSVDRRDTKIKPVAEAVW